ncbi:hypothetical protein HaLaN_21604 [Haematococcus lacustris]|uniref:Uncharacterized protein n=1 Tax=Haematococcus lacustris TaxID=44745 RepID=A0A699ZRX3_HAELA|nr:hypothetical protein HaLaN_21604 [Haematococcus lacustris]
MEVEGQEAAGKLAQSAASGTVAEEPPAAAAAQPQGQSQAEPQDRQGEADKLRERLDAAATSLRKSGAAPGAALLVAYHDLASLLRLAEQLRSDTKKAAAGLQDAPAAQSATEDVQDPQPAYAAGTGAVLPQLVAQLAQDQAPQRMMETLAVVLHGDMRLQSSSMQQ